MRPRKFLPQRRALLLAAPAIAAGAVLSGALPANAALPAGADPNTGSLGPRIRGGDLSFTPQLEAAGVRFRDHGKVRPVERILADRGANYMRLRIWTDPPAGYSTAATMLPMAVRARRAGMRVLLDLHYSDFWADPGHQTTPAAWQDQDLPTLAGTVRRYTRDLIAEFARHDAVDMVQIGNEVTAGMLWPLGQVYLSDGAHWDGFATLLNAGITGAREGAHGRRLPVMLHIDRGGDNGGSVWFYDHILAAGVVDFDVIGLSYYPFWHGPMAALQANLNDLAARYGKDIVIAETAYPWTTGNGDDLANSFNSDSQLPDDAAYPATPQGQADFYSALRGVLAQVPDGRGAGFLAWEPEWIPGVGWEPGAGNPNDNLTMFDWQGNALPSLAAFRG